MRIGIASDFGCNVAWWLRLVAEGNDVAVWIKPEEKKATGDGLVQKASTFDQLLQWCKQGIASGVTTFMLFDSSGIGDLAETAMRSGVPTVGGGKFMDRLEKDREFGFKIAENAGCLLPPYEDFGSFDECLEFAREMGDTPVYFKSDRYLDSDATHGADTGEEMVEYLEHIIRSYGGHGKCILQEKIEGVPVSTARWWNGKTWVGPYETTIEHKKFLNDEKGPSTGCCFNVVWFQEESKLAQALGWNQLAAAFLSEKASPGLYDINALVTPAGDAYFLEWTPRLGYDSEMTSFRLLGNLGQFLAGVALGTALPIVSDDLAFGLRLGVPPYPWEHSMKGDKKTCIGQYVSGELGDLHSGSFIGMELRFNEGRVEAATADGLIGMAYAQGRGLKSLDKEAQKAAGAIRTAGLSYRTDGAKTLSEDAKKLKASGFEIHLDLLR